MLPARKSNSDTSAALGTQGTDTVQAMAMQMPLAALATFGQVSPEQLDGLLAALNAPMERLMS